MRGGNIEQTTNHKQTQKSNKQKTQTGGIAKQVENKKNTHTHKMEIKKKQQK